MSVKHVLIASALLLAFGGSTAMVAAQEEIAAPADQSESVEIRAQTPADQMANKVRSIRRTEYFYQSYGRPDLFAALVTGEFEPSEGGELVDMNSAILVGIMWGATDRFALVEDGSGNGYILRVGDPVINGRIVAVHESSVVASISLYGITSRVVLRLEDREGKR
jgi:hypothetical protein